MIHSPPPKPLQPLISRSKAGKDMNGYQTGHQPKRCLLANPGDYFAPEGLLHLSQTGLNVSSS